MKATGSGLAALLISVLAAGFAQAEYPAYPWPPVPCRPTAPDACGPGFYSVNPCGVIYGPNYCVQPNFPPVCGPCWPGRQSQSPRFLSHPFARGPRDYFMLD